MRTIVGLGNPGMTYHGTRHNVGFAVIQEVVDRHKAKLERRLVSPVDQRPAAVYGEYQAGNGTVRLVMSLTMMNESGDALKALGMPTQELLLVCDDVNLPVGTLRMRPHGGAGGHLGMQSCLEVLGSEKVARLRIGVGTDPLPRELEDFVLSKFLAEERPIIRQAVERAAQACDTWANDGVDIAMTRWNSGAT